MSKFQIFTDSNAELSTELRKKYHLKYVRMGVVVDGVEYPADLDWKAYSSEEFYNWLRKGCHVKTTAVSFTEFEKEFRPYLEKGIDILYVGCSSALTTSLNSCRIVCEDLLKEFPKRKIVCVDSLNASFALGLMAIDATKKQDEGMSLEEVTKWLEDNKLRYNFFATVDTLSYMKKAGRIKGSKAFMGNIFGVKPIFISDAHGNNLGIKTVRGTKNADNALIENFINVVDIKANPEIFIGHAECLNRAQRLKERLERELPGCHITIGDIGPIVGTTCGPGTIGVYGFGKVVTRFVGDGIKE